MPVLASVALLLSGCGPGGGETASPGPPVEGWESATSVAPTSPSPAPPARLRIPALGLDEQLIDLGLTDDGSLEVPEDPDRAGWFTGGGRPGGHGPTVLAGHVDSAEGPAVFGSLTRLGPGEDVLLETSDGRRVTYRVDRVADYPRGSFPTREVFGATVGDELRLITCTGAWDSFTSSYEDNRVVFATAVS